MNRAVFFLFTAILMSSTSIPLSAQILPDSGVDMLVLQLPENRSFDGRQIILEDFNSAGVAVGRLGNDQSYPVVWIPEGSESNFTDTYQVKASLLEVPDKFCGCWDRDYYENGRPTSINEKGLIAGHFDYHHPRASTQEARVQHSAIWEDGRLRFIHQDLEAFFEITPGSALSTTVSSVSDTNVVRGWYRTFGVVSTYTWRREQVGKYTLDLDSGEITTQLVYDYVTKEEGPGDGIVVLSDDGSSVIVQTGSGTVVVSDALVVEQYETGLFVRGETDSYLVMQGTAPDYLYLLITKTDEKLVDQHVTGGRPFQTHLERDGVVQSYIGGDVPQVFDWGLKTTSDLPQLYLNSAGTRFRFFDLDGYRAVFRFSKFKKTGLVYGTLASERSSIYNQFFILRDKPQISDSDTDGILDSSDNCLTVPNPDQADLDGDSTGDACDSDIDGDSVDNAADNCPLVANSNQLDVDIDLIGDACDDLIDNDADGIANDLDNCPAIPNADQANNDQDAFGDACDADDDNDTIEDATDNCPLIANEDQADNEGDNIGDVCDSDDDNDAVEDTIDNCPLIANLGQEDNDSDGAGDVCDSDDDSDLIEDKLDNCPLTFNPDQANTDGVGAGDACNDEFDLDDDDWENDFDNCPNVANRNQSDFDGDSIGDACDTDVDNDGVSNASDSCPLTPLGALVGSSGCSIEQLCPCDAPRQSTLPWKNHGQYVSCVRQAANTFYKEGLITGEEKGRVTEDAAQSACGF